MKKMLFFFSLVLLFTACDEQMVNSCQTLQPEKVTDGTFYTMPQFSPDGNRVAFTSQKNRGIFILTLKDKKIHHLSDLQGEGYGFSFSPDGAYIATTVQNGLQGFGALYSVEDGVQVWKSEAEGRIAPPLWSNGIPHWFNRTAHRLVVPKIQLRSMQNSSERLLTWTEMNKIMVSRDGKVSILTDGYASQLSPDGKKILFKRDGAIHIYNVETKKSKKIAVGDHPSWSSDSNSFLFIKTTDDGDKILTSRLFSVDVNGSNKKEIEIPGNSIVLYPSWSPHKNAILFADDNDGLIKIANILEGGCK